MNFENIDTKITIFPSEYMGLDSYKNTCFFHMITTGHFWRNSMITELSLMYLNEENQWICQIWTLEKEADEYDMLEAFAHKISAVNCIIGFNSNSFHIPYLAHKFQAYELENPLEEKKRIDLLKTLKPIGKKLHISTKLNDLRLFLHLSDELSEIECIGAATALFVYPVILQGTFDVKNAEVLNDELIFFCETTVPFPEDIRIHDDEFYLIGEKNELKIKVKTESNRLKLWFKNYKDYFYLPEDDMVIHKSLASTISKDKKRKAKPEECFSYITCTEVFLNNRENQKKYLVALLEHFMH